MGVLALQRATIDCEPHFVEHHGEHGKMECSVQISSVIVIFAYMAKYAAFVAAQCPLCDKPGSICAAAIAMLIAAIGDFAEVGSGFELTCGKITAERNAKMNPGSVSDGHGASHH